MCPYTCAIYRRLFDNTLHENKKVPLDGVSGVPTQRYDVEYSNKHLLIEVFENGQEQYNITPPMVKF